MRDVRKPWLVAAMLTVYAGGLMPDGATRPVFLYLGNAEGDGKTTAARARRNILRRRRRRTRADR